MLNPHVNQKLLILVATTIVVTIYLFVLNSKAVEYPTYRGIKLEPEPLPEEIFLNGTTNSEIVYEAQDPEIPVVDETEFDDLRAAYRRIEHFVRVNRIPFVKDEKYDEILGMKQCDLTKDESNPKNDVGKILNGFHKCIDPIVGYYKKNPEQMLNQWVDRTKHCDDIPEYENLKIHPLQNGDEIKRHIYPNCREKTVHVTLGIGHDVIAEKKLNMSQPDTVFYGADPVIEPNAKIFSELGKFFPFAVAREAGVSSFRVLATHLRKAKYMFLDVTAVDIIYFFKNILKVTKIDSLFVDIEGAEQTFLDYFHVGGEFDKNGITICQFNMEIHSIVWPHGYQTTSKFLEQLLKDNRYIFVKPTPQRRGVFKQYFINVKDPECVRKFLQ
ncbi:unnamed protein product [Caenorhabditis angaria]|uniref:Methyltransferase FkbM domain-containing protein n=1 Tax=Caenorhabditis angaria TaxID=860376 RepID=A0A9P1MTD7_9PELO|nr:unnamed protein product [Caenorhabditis angaria]